MGTANRGNVAIIAWNTLNARTWYVTGENLDGEVSLGTDGESKTLLEINFVDFTDKAGELKEIENVKVAKTPSMTKDLGDRQVAFNTSIWNDVDGDFVNSFDFEIGAPRRNEETTTYVEDANIDSDVANNVVAYVPEDVWEDLDSLYGKELRVVFGEDNVVALIVVTNDEVIDNEFFTKYVAEDKELTIGGTKYKLAGEAANTTTTVNNVTEEDGLEEALKNILGVEEITTSKFDKKIKANVILNSKGKVTEVNLYVSGDFAKYYTNEFIVGKVRNEKIQDHTSTTIYDSKDIEEEDLPKVTIDGEKASIDEIRVGDVLTVYYKDNRRNATEIVKILASRNTVEGEVTDIDKKNELKINGEKYQMSKATALLVTDEIKDDTTTAKNDFTTYYEENVTLYLNVYGEYVAVMADEEVEDYQFGIVDYYFKAEQDEDGVYTQKLRIFLDGASSSKYKLVFDSKAEDDEIAKLVTGTDDTATRTETKGALDGKNALLAALTDAMDDPDSADDVDQDKTALVVFKADSNNEIELDDISVIAYDAADLTGTIIENKYELHELVGNTTKADYDNKRVTIGTKRYNVTGAAIAQSKDAEEEPEAITWKKLVDQANDKISVDALAFCKKDKYDIVYIVTVDDAVGESDAEYAVVNGLDASKKLGNKTYHDVVTLLTENNDTIYLSANDNTDANIDVNTIISYKESSDKVTASTTLVDIDKLNRGDSTEAVRGIYANELIAFRAHVALTDADAVCGCGHLEAPTDESGCTDGRHVAPTDANAVCACGHVAAPGTTAACTETTITKAALKVSKVDGEYLVYTDDEDNTLPDIKVNTDDVVVFDATGDEIVVSNYDSIEDGDLVVPFVDDADEAILLVIVKE